MPGHGFGRAEACTHGFDTEQAFGISHGVSFIESTVGADADHVRGNEFEIDGIRHSFVSGELFTGMVEQSGNTGGFDDHGFAFFKTFRVGVFESGIFFTDLAVGEAGIPADTFGGGEIFGNGGQALFE